MKHAVQYHNSVHQVTNAAILNFDFNLYDKIVSFTVLHILQIQMFLSLTSKTSVFFGTLNTRCEV